MHSFISSSKVVLLIFIPFVICTYCVAEAVQNTAIPALFAFGDSVLDTGNNNFIVTLGKGDYTPYGEDFVGGKPTGRFSNGKIPSDLIAEGLGIKELLPPYLDPTLKDSDLLTGVSFASAASGYDPLTPSLMSVLSMPDQLEMFKEYIATLEKIVGHERSSTIISQSQIIVHAGSADLLNTYYGATLRRVEYDVSSYADFIVGYASRFVQGLFELGARRIAVFGLPPIGCIPSERTLAGGLLRACAEDRNQAVQLVNAKLMNAIQNSLNQYALPRSRVVYVDLYSPLLDLVRYPHKYGFKVNDRGCCGTGIIEAALFCNKFSGTCADRSEYLFFDSFHPTEKAYKILMDDIIQKFA